MDQVDLFTMLTFEVKWMAPESVSLRVFSSQSDLWSFGICVIEMLTRVDPYPEITPAEVAFRMGQPNSPLRPEIPANIPKIFKNIMDQCFQENPGARGTFEDIEQKLDLVLKTGTVSVSKPQTLQT